MGQDKILSTDVYQAKILSTDIYLSIYISVFQWSTGYWFWIAIFAGLLRRQMLNSSAS
jgi:hypothetical protein